MAAPGLTASENQQLQRLLAKAKTAAGPSGRGSLVPIYDSETGNMFDPTTGVSHNIWDDETESWDDTGAMFMGAGGQPESKRVNMASGLPVTQPAYASPVSTEVPFPMDYASASMVGDLPPFPTGVTDLEMWGRTMICFGLFAKDDLSYSELAFSQEERKVSYVKWVMSRRAVATGNLKDLCSYLMHVKFDDRLINHLVIPGTHHSEACPQAMITYQCYRFLKIQSTAAIWMFFLLVSLRSRGINQDRKRTELLNFRYYNRS